MLDPETPNCFEVFDLDVHLLTRLFYARRREEDGALIATGTCPPSDVVRFMVWLSAIVRQERAPRAAPWAGVDQQRQATALRQQMIAMADAAGATVLAQTSLAGVRSRPGAFSITVEVA